MSEVTQEFHRELLDSINVLYQASGAFRVLILTDTADLSSYRSYGWPIEHLPSERSLRSLGIEDWLRAASDRFRWVLETYKPGYVVAASNRAAMRYLLTDIANSLGLTRHALEGVKKLFVGISPNGVPLHVGWRGWLQEVSRGVSTHEVQTDNGCLKLTINRTKSHNSLILMAGNSVADDVEKEAMRLGWNIVDISLDEVLTTTDLIQASAAVRGAWSQVPFVVAVVDECDAVKLICEREAVDVAVWWNSASGNWELLTGYGRRLDEGVMMSEGLLERLETIERVSRTISS